MSRVAEKVSFDWENGLFEGLIEKEYENSVLVAVINPNRELRDKYMSRIVISKKNLHHS